MIPEYFHGYVFISLMISLCHGGIFIDYLLGKIRMYI